MPTRTPLKRQPHALRMPDDLIVPDLLHIAKRMRANETPRRTDGSLRSAKLDRRSPSHVRTQRSHDCCRMSLFSIGYLLVCYLHSVTIKEQKQSGRRRNGPRRETAVEGPKEATVIEPKTNALYWGYFAREVSDDLVDAGKEPLEARDVNGLSLEGQHSMAAARILSMCHREGILNGDADERIMRIMDLMDTNKPDTSKGPEFHVGYYMYDRQTVTVAEAAEILGVSKQRVYALIESGDLTGFKDGSEWRLFRKRVDSRARKK